MCLGLPGKVVAIRKNQAKIKQENHYHWLDISLIDGEVKVGDYLLNYQTTAVNKISTLEAKKILNLIKQ